MSKKKSIRDYIFFRITAILLAFEVLMFAATYKLIVKDFFSSSINNYLKSSHEHFKSNGKNIVKQINIESIKIINDSEIYNIINENIDIEEKRTRIASCVESMRESLTMFSYLEIIDFDGNVYSLTDKNFNTENVDLSFISKKEKYNLYLSNQIISDNNSNRYLVFGKMMKNYFTGGEAGFLLMFVDETVFETIYKNSRLKDNNFYVIRDNYIISSNDKNVIGNYFSDEQYRLSKKNADFSFDDFTFTIGPGINLACFAMLSKTNINAAFKKILVRMFIVTAIVILLSIIVARIISNDLTKKIAGLNIKINNFSQGKKVKFDRISNDEIGELEKNFKKMIEDIESLMERNIEEKQRQKEAELSALQAQINPHFVYNAINAIRSMALVDDNWDIERACTALSNFFRIGLNRGKDTVAVFSEMKHVQSYVEIEKIRFPDRFDVSYDIDNSIMKLKILKTIIQPLVENSIKHGFRELNQKGKIKIVGYPEGDYIIIKVIDNGRGIDVDPLIRKEEHRKEQSGYGVFNVYERIVLFYGQDCGLTYSETENGGTTVTVKVKNIGFEDDEGKGII